MNNLVVKLESIHNRLQNAKIEYETLNNQKKEVEKTLREITRQIQDQYQVVPDEIVKLLDELKDEITNGLLDMETKLIEME